MQEKDLEEMGVEAKGDRVKLKAFCLQNNGRETRMKQLKEIIEKGKSTRVQAKTKPKNTSTTSTPRSPKSTLKMEFRWKHYVEGAGYKLKRAAEGGGLRIQNVSRFASLEDCLKAAENLFFPDGENSEGKLEDLSRNLEDFKGNLLDVLDPFTAEAYKKRYGLHTLRLVLLTKNMREVYTVESSGELSDEDMSTTWQMSTSIFDNLPDTYEPSYSNEPDRMYQLIGTSAERTRLKNDIDQEYEKSLAADRAKKKDEEDHAGRVELQAARTQCTPPEPKMNEPHINVSVRHPDLGVVSRAFTLDAKAAGIYAWVGSLSTSPKHFALTRPSPRIILYPSEDAVSVASSMLYMEELEEPLPLSVDTKGIDKDEDTTENFQSIAVQSSPPSQLMEEDQALSEQDQTARNLLELLQVKRLKIQEELKRPQSVKISRHNSCKELLNLYKEENVIQSKLDLAFKDEAAVGEGVCRDVYAVFWDSYVTNYCEGVSQFAFAVSPTITSTDYVTMGRILTHQFIQTGTIPLQLSEALIQQAVVGTVSEECLLQSFLMLLHEKEREVIQQALLGTTEPFPTNEVVDILSDYNAGTVPRPDNIRQVLLQVSVTELISKPFMCITKLREGMGSFWDGVSAEEIHALYSCCTPTPSNVVSSLYFVTSNQQEEKISKWLVRYLKSQDQKTLSRFLRFCTGSDLVYPGKSIKVEMVTMSDLAMRPKAQTCFSILTLSKNYRSYAHFYDNLDFYMHNPQVWELQDM